MNYIKKILGVVTLFAIAFFVVGCDGSNDNSTEIVVVTPAAQHGWMAGVIFFAEEAGRELGFENFRILTSTNVAEQSAQLDDLIAQGVGAIVLQPHNFELQLPAERVLEANIPLILFNRYLEGIDYDAYVAGSNFQMGAESARKIATGIGGQGFVVTVANPSAGSTSVVRNEGFASIIAGYPNITTFEMTVENFTQEAALSSMADVLVANPHIDAIFSIDDETSLGILQAIRESGRTDIQFISGGGGAQTYFREIATESINLFSATYSPRMMGDAIRVAYDIVNGRPVPQLDANNQWIIPPSIVTRDNVTNFFAPDSPY
jgi:ribose transport system substrate-binding protein